VEHYIDTSGAAPILPKRRRQIQMEDTVVDNNVGKMLTAGVLEEGNAAWGFSALVHSSV
jgi:hypothetical protein